MAMSFLAITTSRLCIGIALVVFQTTTVIAKPNTAPNITSVEIITSPTEGTFQVIWTSVKNRDYFGTELYVWIEENRDQSEVKYFALTEDTFIMILPMDAISDPSFIPLEEVYIYNEVFKLDHRQ